MLLFFNSPTTSASERNKLLRKCKPLYQQYCSFVKGNPKSNVEDLNKKIVQLLEQMTLWEAEQIHNFTCSRAIKKQKHSIYPIKQIFF